MAGRAALAAIIAVAAFLRLFELQFGEYQWDDDGIWSLAVDAVRNQTLPAKGIISTLGASNGPFQVYLMMPVAAATREPLAGMVVVALLNVAAIYFVYRFVREFFGERAALLAGLLFALNSWSVMYSRHLAVQGMLIPFQVLFFWNASRWLARGHSLDLALAFVWLAVASQTYIAGLVHLASMAVVLAMGWRRLRPAPLASGMALWAALSARYLLSVLTAERQFLTPELTGERALDLSSVRFALEQALHTAYEQLATQTQPALQPVIGLEMALAIIEAALFVAGVMYVTWRVLTHVREGKPAAVEAVLLLWLLAPVLIYLRHQEILTPRHLAPLLPVPAIFTGLLLDRLWPRLGGPLLALISGNAVGLAGVLFSAIPTCGMNSGYALPYQQTFQLARSVEQLARGSGADRVYVYGRPSLSPILQAIMSRDGLRAEWVDTTHGSSLALPASQAIYVTLDESSDVARLLRDRLADAQAVEQAIPCEDMTFRSYAASPERAQAIAKAELPAKLNLRAAGGIELVRLAADRRLVPGQPLPVAVEWAREGSAKATLFAHLLDTNGRQVAGSDRQLGGGSAGVEWQDLPIPGQLPGGRYILELGLYDEHGERLAVNGGSSVVWGPLAVGPPPVSTADLRPASVRFGEQIELDGYRLEPAAVVLQWRALAQPPADYTVFVHVLDAWGKLVAQADSQPLGGEFPTGTWRPGETIADRHVLSMPPEARRIEVGLYELGSGQRLPGGPLVIELS